MKNTKSPNRKKLGTAPNRKAAAARLELAPEMLKDAMDAGCDAFGSGGRVDCDKLMAWLAANPKFVEKWNGEKGGIPPRSISQAVSAHYDALERKRKYEEKIGRLISVGEISQRLRGLAVKQRAILEKYVSAEVLVEICELMQAEVLEWSRKEK